MHETRRLAEWVTRTGYDNLPGEVIKATRLYVLDDFASGFAGADTAWTDMVAHLVAENEGGSGPCSLFGRTQWASRGGAALINGVSVGGFEVDHPYSAGSCHPSGAVFPAVLAAAEAEHVDGKRFLEAIATGYEAVCRVSAGATRAVEDERGFHGPGTNAPFGAAFGVSKVLGFDVDKTLHAVGIAGSSGAGLVEFHHEGAMTKRLHLGRGSQLGLEAAVLAGAGFTGPSTVLEGEHGFLHAYSPTPKPEAVLRDLGEKYLMLGVSLKAFPCHISFHAVIDALVAFRREHAFTPSQVESVTVRSDTRMLDDRFGDRSPATLMGAQYSMPWTMAVALCRDVESPATWTGMDFADPDFVRIAAQIECLREPAPEPAVAQIDLRVAGVDYTLQAVDWPGAPTRPATFDDVAHKLRAYSSAFLTPGAADELINRIAEIERESDIAPLARLIAVAPR